MLKKKIPDTFGVICTVETADYGLLPVKRRRGEGSSTTDLSTRIGDNFFNKFIRFVNFCSFSVLEFFVGLQT